MSELPGSRKNALAEVERLRNLLRKLEWVGERYASESCCPICVAYPPGPHVDHCWLAAELRGERDG